MDALFTEMIPFLKDAWVTAGWLGVLGIGLMFLVRFFRLSFIQNFIPVQLVKFRWDSWPTWLKVTSVFVGGFAGTLVLKLGGGMPWGPSLSAGVTAAILSIGGNALTKKLGEVEGAVRVKMNPEYKPSLPRKISGFVVLNAKRFRAHGGS